MLRKGSRGISLYKAILLGEMLRFIDDSVYSFWNDKFEKVLLINSIKENIWFEHIKDENFRKSNFGPSKLRIYNTINAIKQINDMIIDFNDTVLSVEGIQQKIKTINIKYIGKIIKERASISLKLNDPKAFDLADENLRLKVYRELKKVSDSISDIEKYMEDSERFSGLEYINKRYKKSIIEAKNVYSFGYGETATLCMGRAIESAINDYLRYLYKNKKINQTELKGKLKIRYVDRIGFLLSKKFISEEEFLKMKAFAFDRNKGGHPDLGRIDLDRAKTLIQQGIWIVIDLQKKIKLKN